MAVFNCKAIYGIQNVCGDLLQASGLDKDAYAFYVSDLSVRFPLTQTAAISSISFLPYNGLIKFSGQKFSHEASEDLAKAAGGSISFVPKFSLRTMPLSTQDDVEVQLLSQAQDIAWILQDNNENFFIFGASKGMTAEAGTLKNFGKEQGADILTTISFTGNEKVLPLRFSAGTTAQTISLLESYIR